MNVFTQEELDSEEWRPFPGSTRHEVSSLGRLRRAGSKQPISGKIDRRYGRVILSYYVDGKRRYKFVHRAVLEAFVGPCPNGMECCHEDDDGQNNRLTNLRWDTRDGNNLDRIRNGLHQHGEDHCHAKLTEEAVRKIRADARPIQRIAEEYGVSWATVYAAKTGKAWRHVQ